MTFGPGIYDDLCTSVRETAGVTEEGGAGHHDDYSKPLEVRWFCHPCHIQHHRNIK